MSSESVPSPLPNSPTADALPIAPPPPVCLNCDTPLHGRYCHACGQLDFDFRRSFWHVVADVFESLFHLDGRLTHSVCDLLFRPGRLTAAFLKGKRTSQVPPLRFYLFVTLVFFLTMNLRRPDFDHDSAVTIPAPATAEETDSSSSVEENFFDKATPLSDPARIKSWAETMLPKVIFVTVPVIALGTLLLFRNYRYTYLEHLVIALHLFTFYFTFALVAEGWAGLLNLVSPAFASFSKNAADVYSLFYPVLLLRYVFGLKFWPAIWRTAVLYSAFGVVFAIALITSFVGFYLLE